MNPTKKAWTLQSLGSPGHVNCVALGRKSARVMATGGLDNCVSLWAVGKSGCIMKLSDHSSPIESLCFAQDENKLAAGSASGSVKVWELEEAKEVRTLPGHKSTVSSVSFHPFGNIITTGSMDCNVKLWDVRKKTCIYTYKGHTGSVSCLSFCPDGRWLASGSSDKSLKIWDLTAGKVLQQFQDHSAEVTDVQFHPNVLILASASRDRSVNMYDLETFSLLPAPHASGASHNAGAVEKLCFHPQQDVLYAATGDYLKIYNCEPLTYLESVSVGWHSGFSDMALSDQFNQLIGVAATQTAVNTFVVDIAQCAPFVEVQTTERAGLFGVDKSSHPSRMSFCNDPNKMVIPKEDPKPHKCSAPSGDEESAQVEIQDQEEFNKLFRARNNNNPLAPHFQKQPVPNNAAPTRNPVLGDERQFSAGESYRKTSNYVEDASSNQNRSPDKQPPQVNPAVATSPDRPDEVIIHDIDQMHSSVNKALHGRQNNLSHVRTLWYPDNVGLAINAAIHTKDNAVVVDLLSILVQRDHLFTLDVVLQLLPSLLLIVRSKHERHVEIACSTLKIVLTHFSGLIRQNITAPPGMANFVDLSREERYKKCQECYKYLIEIRDVLLNRSPADRAALMKDVLILLNLLEP